MAKKKITAEIAEMKNIAAEIYSMWVKVGDMASDSHPGQFVSLFPGSGDKLLPRPISICEIDRERQMLRLVFRIAGEGTKEFSKLQTGNSIAAFGPLGNGFPLKDKAAILIGGGIGIPPMLQLAKELPGKKIIILGYRDSELFLKEDFEPYGEVYVATEDGSIGTKGNVLNACAENKLSEEAEIIYSCGPTPMLRGVKAYGLNHGIETWLSLEERMACGIGACLACVCKSEKVDEHSKVENKRVCADGPVFLSTEWRSE